MMLSGVNGFQHYGTEKNINNLLSEFKEIYHLFPYLSLSEKELYDLILKRIDKTKDLLIDPNNAFNFFNKFISIVFKQKEDLDDIFNCFDKLQLLCNILNYEINYDLLSQLLEHNQMFWDVIDEVFNKHKKTIINGGVEQEFKNNILIDSIEVFSLVNGISIRSDSKQEIYDDLEDIVQIYLRDLRHGRLLNGEKELLLGKEIAKGNIKARNLLIESNLRLVAAMARKFTGKGVDYLDLIQEGTLGLIKAVEKYDYTKGNRFSTYAIYWINQAMRRAIANYSRTIRIPVHLLENINKVDAIQKDLFSVFGREPTDEEIAQRFNMDPDRVREMLNLIHEPISLETPIGVKETPLGDFIKDNSTLSPDICVEKRLLIEEVRELLDTLPEREKAILKLRFGFINDRCYSFEEIGTVLNISKQRVHQIEKAAMKKLVRSAQFKKMEEYANHPDELQEVIKRSYKITNENVRDHIRVR